MLVKPCMFPCIKNCWARPQGLQKIVSGGQRAEKFENH